MVVRDTAYSPILMPLTNPRICGGLDFFVAENVTLRCCESQALEQDYDDGER